MRDKVDNDNASTATVIKDSTEDETAVDNNNYRVVEIESRTKILPLRKFRCNLFVADFVHVGSVKRHNTETSIEER